MDLIWIEYEFWHRRVSCRNAFSERFAGYPVRVEVLSRFLTNAQAKKVIEGLAGGEIDVVIGTHRLLAPELRFKDLGLLSSGHLVEASRSTLVGRYVGETAVKTRGVAQSAVGGVLVGSVSSEVVQHSACPVVIVPHKP